MDLPIARSIGHSEGSDDPPTPVALLSSGFVRSFQGAPNVFQQIMQHGIVFLELRPHEGVKVVAVEISLGPFSEVFLVIDRGISADPLTGVEEHFVIETGPHRLLVGRFDARFIEAKDLVVI